MWNLSNRQTSKIWFLLINKKGDLMAAVNNTHRYFGPAWVISPSSTATSTSSVPSGSAANFDSSPFDLPSVSVKPSLSLPRSSIWVTKEDKTRTFSEDLKSGAMFPFTWIHSICTADTEPALDLTLTSWVLRSQVDNSGTITSKLALVRTCDLSSFHCPVCKWMCMCCEGLAQTTSECGLGDEISNVT